MSNLLAVRAILVDPRPLFCEAIRACLEKGGHAVACQAPTLDDALHQLDSVAANLVLVGSHMAEQSLSACRELSTRTPAIKVILITGHAGDPLFLADAVYVGVAACLVPETTADELLTAIAKVMAGQQLFSRDILELAFQPIALTPRELDVLKLMAEESTDREIAQALGIRLATVRNHTQRIMEKLNVHHRNEAIWRARHRGLVDLNDAAH